MKSFVLMKAMPPTTGHLQLIRFAQSLGATTVLVDTLSDEPMIEERISALTAATDATVKHISHDLPQDPTHEGFREMWKGILIGAGALPGDYLVTSEAYGKWLADITDLQWMPYDIDRVMNRARATDVRHDFVADWQYILPEFRRHLQTRVTIFGAESTGKTYLSRLLADWLGAALLPEWARTYLENAENRICTETMTRIWHGQAALQRQDFLDSPIVIQDTDLFSTLGYWQYWANHYDSFEAYAGPRLGSYPPPELREEAHELKSDLYLTTKSNIPFEPDPLRYGGDQREIGDDYWVNFLGWEKGMWARHHVLQGQLRTDRMYEAEALIMKKIAEKQSLIAYSRP